MDAGPAEHSGVLTRYEADEPGPILSLRSLPIGPVAQRSTSGRLVRPQD